MFRKTAICMAIFATIFGVVEQADKEQKSLEPDFTIDVYGSDDGTVLLVPSCLLYTSPSPRDQRGSRMPSSA